MKSNSILFIVDHKHRDLPSLSLIGFYLQKKGFEVSFCGTSMESEVFEKADPEFIIIPKLTYSTNSQLHWKIDGRKIIIVETEGNNQDKEIKYRTTVYPDLYFFWNNSVKNIYSDDLQGHDTKIIVGGYYRSDFFFAPLNKIFNPDEIKRSIGIDNQFPTITIATSTQDSHFSSERIKNKKKKRKRSFDITPDYELIVKNMRTLRTITENFLISADNEINKKVNFVIKPHPNESIIYWHELIEKNNLKNCYLMVGTNINHLLSISDFHISHNVCTTTAEAIMSDIPTAEIQTELSDELYADEHLNLPDYKLKNKRDLIEVINNYFTKTNKKKNTKIDKYIKSFFTMNDGKRCKFYANEIEKFVNEDNKNKLSMKSKIKYSFLISLIALRNKVMFIRTAKNKKIIEEVYQLKKESSVKISGINVHKEYGLFDNKIQTDDYKVWYKKFEELGV